MMEHSINPNTIERAGQPALCLIRRVLIAIIIFAMTSSSSAIQKLKPEKPATETIQERQRKEVEEMTKKPAVPPLELKMRETDEGSILGLSLHERVADFVVKNSLELQRLKESSKMIENIKFDFGGKYAQETASTTGGNLATGRDNQRWEVMFNLTLVDKKTLREQELQYIQTERKIRQDVINLVEQYIQTQKAIEKAKSKLALWNQYLAWTEKRVQAGVEYAKTYYELMLGMGNKENKAEQAKSLTYIAEMICSYVGKDNCYNIKKMLGANKINPNETIAIDEDIE